MKRRDKHQHVCACTRKGTKTYMHVPETVLTRALNTKIGATTRYDMDKQKSRSQRRSAFDNATSAHKKPNQTLTHSYHSKRQRRGQRERPSLRPSSSVGSSTCCQERGPSKRIQAVDVSNCQGISEPPFDFILSPNRCGQSADPKQKATNNLSDPVDKVVERSSSNGEQTRAVVRIECPSVPDVTCEEERPHQNNHLSSVKISVVSMRVRELDVADTHETAGRSRDNRQETRGRTRSCVRANKSPLISLFHVGCG